MTATLLKKANILVRHKSAKDAFYLIAGRGGIHFLVLISQPILAFLFKPEQFGEFALYNSILAILLILSSGRYEAGIVLARKVTHANGLFQLAQSWLFGITFILGLVSIINYSFGSFPTTILPTGALLLLPVAVLFAGYWQVVQNWLVRFRKHQQLSFTLLIQRIIIILSSISAALLLPDQNGLIIGLFAGLTYTFLYAIRTKNSSLRTNTKRLVAYAAYFKDFPLYSIPTLLLSLATLHLPVIWLSTFFNESTTGYYSMAFMAINIPFTLFSSSLAPLFYERMSRRNMHEQYALFKKVCKITITFLGPLALFSLIYGDDILLWVLGKKWLQTGEIVVLLSPLILTMCLESWLSITLTVINKQRLGMQLQLTKLMLLLLIFVTGTLLNDPNLIFSLICTVSFYYLGVAGFVVFRFFKKHHDPYSNSALAE